MTKRKSIKLNYIYNLVYQVLLIIVPFIVTPYISRVLNADGIGKVSFAESIVSYFVLFATIGINTYGQREISYVQNDVSKQSKIFYNLLILKFITTGIILALYLFLIIYLKLDYIYMLFSLNILSVAFDITWFFQGLEEFGKIVLRNSVIKIISAVFIFIFVKTKNDLLLYVFSLTVFTLLGQISLWSYLSKYLDKIVYKYLQPFRDIKVILSLFIPTIAIQIYTVLDKSMIGIITKSDFENGYYEQAIKMSRVVLMLVTSLGIATAPRVGKYFGEKSFDNVKKLIYKSYQYVLFLGIPLCLGLIIISDNFVPWFYGSGYEKVSVLMKILSFLILAIGINNVTGIQLLIPTKRENIFTFTVICGAVINFLLNMILIRYFLSIGAAIASVVAETSIAIIQLLLVKDEIDAKKILLSGKNYYIAGCIMFLVVLPFVRSFYPSFIHTLMLVFIGVSVYLMILYILKDDFLITNINQIIIKLKNRLKKL